MPFINLPAQAPDFPKDSLYDPVAIDFFHLFTLMAHPDDPKARVQVSRAVSAGNIKSVIEDTQEHVRKHGGAVNIDGEVASFLFNSPDMYTELARATDKSGYSGQLAGLALGYMVFRHERPDTRTSASLGAAFRMIEEGCRKGGWPGGSKENMKRHVWPTYRPVAHLWAAYHFLTPTIFGFAKDGLKAEHIKLFMWACEWFRKKGEALIPLRAKEPVLRPAETWKFRPAIRQEWPKAELVEQDLDRWDLRISVTPRQQKS